MELYTRRTSLNVSDIFDAYPFDNCNTDVAAGNGIDISKNHTHEEIVETEQEKKERIKSQWVICIAMFIWSITLIIPTPGLFPYLKLLEENTQLSKKKLGLVVAVNPLGLMIFSPLLGFITMKLGSIRMTGYVSVIVSVFANLLYGSLPYCKEFWEDSAYHLMIIARLLVGVSSGFISVCRAYLAESTTLKERTGVLAKQSASRSLGLIIGSVLQIILFIVISDVEFQYQATGYLPAVLSVFVIILFTPLFFKEYHGAGKIKEKLPIGELPTLPKPDYFGIMGLMFGIFAVTFIYVLIETILTPFVQDQYGWCDEMAVVIVGFLLSLTGIIFMINFLLSAKLAKKYDERKILLLLSCCMTMVGLILFYPYAGGKLVYCDESVEIINNNSNSTIFNYFCPNVTDCLGCPPDQEWCNEVPKLPFSQFIISFSIIVSCFPFGISMINTLLSKMLGPNPQAVWLGLLTSAGSLARISGPIVVSYVYSEFGTRYMDGLLFVILLIATIEMLCLYPRLIPMKLDKVFNDINSNHSNDINSNHSNDIDSNHSNDINSNHSNDINSNHSNDINSNNSKDINSPTQR